MEENLKQKLNKINSIFLVFLSLCFGSRVIAETREEDLTEEFFNAAMQVDLPEKGVEAGVDSAIQNAGTAAEQNMAAEQVGEETLNAGTNVLISIKEWLSDITSKLQGFGNHIGENIGQYTGGNPFITKIIVGLILVLVSIIVITILILIAKKFVFNKNKLQTLSDDEYEDFDEDDEDFETQEELSDDFEDFDDIQDEETVISQNQTNNNMMSSPIAKTVSSSPASIEDAIKIFLEVTE